jgi:hypothetical protein
MTESWWAETSAAALLGTGRRPPPPLPEELGVAGRTEASAEERLLDAAALGGMLVRAGRSAMSPDDVDLLAAPAEADAWAPAPDRAVHLLQLILGQPPFGSRLATTALRRWLMVAVERRRRVPHAELPLLLGAVAKAADLQPLAARVAGARGRWLAGANPAWEWLDASGPEGPGGPPSPPPAASTAGWATLPTAERVVLLGRLRLSDPAAGRALLESTWSSETGRDRTVLLAAMADGLGLDDQALLERALDDRAAGVRAGAQKLLDRLPGSERAERMAQRLRPLVRMTGMLRRTLDVELPTSPDAAGVRDGLGRKPATSASERGFWLEQIVAGAPLEVWTEVTGREPAETWRMISAASPDARAGVRRAAIARRDTAWLRAMAAEGVDPGLLAFLPPQDAAELAVAQIPRMPAYALHDALAGLPRPWSPDLASVVVDRVAAEKEPAWLLDSLLPVLADGLSADIVPRLQRWARADDSPRALAHLVQYLSFVPAIPEAFG